MKETDTELLSSAHSLPFPRQPWAPSLVLDPSESIPWVSPDESPVFAVLLPLVMPWPSLRAGSGAALPSPTSCTALELPLFQPQLSRHSLTLTLNPLRKAWLAMGSHF